MAKETSGTDRSYTSLRKAQATKRSLKTIYDDKQFWVVQQGKLQRSQGRPQKTEHLFRVVGEKLPFAALEEIRADLRQLHLGMEGVYVAHDSMGCPRYIGRGRIFGRLKARKKAHPLELEYFSFYVVSEKKHEREVETLLIRAAGFLLEFNTRKKRVGLESGNVRDYEAGTVFYERQRRKGVVKRKRLG